MRLFAGHTSQTDEPFEHHLFYWSSRRLNPVSCGRTPKNNADHRKHLRVYAGGAATHTFMSDTANHPLPLWRALTE